jgi:hypothetical protein
MNRRHPLRSVAQSSSPDTFAGHWSAILWQPDITGVQTFAIGVVVIGEGKPAYRLMDEPGRLACFYQPQAMTKDFAWLLSVTRSTLAEHDAGAPLTLPIFNLSLTPPRYVSGESAQAIADHLFAELVPAAQTEGKQRKTRENLDTPSLRTLVHRELKRIANLDYEHIVREKNEVIHDRGDHLFDVDIVTAKGVGSVISADYQAQVSIERNLLRAAQDVGSYGKVREKDSRGIFIYAPDRIQLPTKQRRDLEDYLLSECWKLEAAGFQVATNLHPEPLAQDVFEWATPLLA